jgi:hypothetical protein
MDEDTTTVQDVQATGAEEASPVEQEQSETADAQVASEPSESEQDAEAEQPDPSAVDDRLRKYATSQGIDLDSPSAIKAARLAMKAQSEATKNSLRASELEKATVAISDEDAVATAEATGQDPELIKRLQRVEVKEAIRDFWGQEGIDRSFEPAMIDLLKTKPYLAGDLESLYASAVMKSGGVAAVKSQGKREALESLAHKQQAAVPRGNATTGASPKEKPFHELSIPEMEKKLGVFRV